MQISSNKNDVIEYDGSVTFPFGVMGIRTEGTNLVGLDFLPVGTREVLPRTATGKQVWNALFAYLEDPTKLVEVALASEGTEFQIKVWNTLRRIPVGQVWTYGELAKSLDTAPRAAANACRRNKIPILIPCHRIVAKTGLGGYFGTTSGEMLEIKRWLLQHEGQHKQLI
jgi:methylated-DNA-[protein]-cysteine S-methyltransferase